MGRGVGNTKNAAVASTAVLRNANLTRALRKATPDSSERLSEEQIHALNEYLRAGIAAGDHHRPTGLTQDDDPDSFRYVSETLMSVREDPEYRDDLQVMIDLDETLFPLQSAIEEMGIDFGQGTREWSDEYNTLAALIAAQHYGRPDLAERDLDEEQRTELNELSEEFFSRLHCDADLMNRAGVFEHAPQVIQALKAQGVKIHLFTHRDPSSRPAALAWLEAMGIPHDQLIVINHDHPESDKARYCEENRIPVLIDDKPATIANGERRNIEAIALGWNFNQAAIHDHGADEAQCWREIAHLTIGHLEQAVIRRKEAQAK